MQCFDFTYSCKARKQESKKRIDCQLIVYSFEDYFSAASFFLPAASIFQPFSRDSPILLWLSPLASTLAAAVLHSLTHSVLLLR
jgi:hypothetical protein